MKWPEIIEYKGVRLILNSHFVEEPRVARTAKVVGVNDDGSLKLSPDDPMPAVPCGLYNVCNLNGRKLGLIKLYLGNLKLIGHVRIEDEDQWMNYAWFKQSDECFSFYDYLLTVFSELTDYWFVVDGLDIAHTK
jgi:hypothetical protein